MSVRLRDCSPSKTVTYKNYSSLASGDPEAALNKVRRVTRQNLENTLRLLKYNRHHRVQVYRFSSKVAPLATHHELAHWNYIADIADLLEDVGRFVREHGMRVSFHPDHYTLINSPSEDVFKASLVDYRHHCRLLEGMGLDERARLITHVGGAYGNKAKSLERFLENWQRVPSGITARLVLENDDKIYSARDVLYLCGKLKIPMVLDVHHFHCHHEEDSFLGEILPCFFDTWEGTGLNPKLHVSSPKNDKDFRSHHDFVEASDVYKLLKEIREFNRDVDIMVEAKNKDQAMFRLVSDLSEMPGLQPLGDAELLYP